MKRVAVLLLVSLHIWVLTQLRFEAWPEMLLIPYLQLNGFKLYQDMVYHYTPGLAWIGKLWFGWLGVSVTNLKLLTWGLIGLVDVLVFVIAQKKWGFRAAVVALVSLVALQPLFDGNGLWYDLALTPILLLAYFSQHPAFLALAFVFKQSIFWFFPLMYRRLELLILLIAATFLGLASWFFLQGSLEGFLFWPFRFIFTIFPLAPGYRDLATWRHWVLPLSIVGGVVMVKMIKERSFSWLFEPKEPLPWALAGFLLIFPRFALFRLQSMVAFLALGIGQGYKSYRTDRTYKVAGVLLLICLLFFWTRVIRTQWGKEDRFLEPEVYQQAAKVAATTDPDEPVLLLNTNEIIYVLADRLPPKPWLTQFPWFLELPGFQEELVESFKKQNLHQVITTPYQDEGEYVPGSYQPKQLLDFINNLTNHDR